MRVNSTGLLRLRAEFASKRFLAREYAFGCLTHRRPLKILFSDRDGWVEPLARKLRLTRHQFAFGDLRHADLAGYDLVVPLSMEDLRFLSGLRAELRTLIPIPSPEAIDLCDDKLKFHAHLRRHGFERWLPRTGVSLAYPYVLKKSVDEAGEHCHIVTDEESESAVAADRAKPDFFVEEFVPGTREFASHILFMGGRVVTSLDVEYRYTTEFPIKGKTWPVFKTVRRSRHLPLFTGMLNAVRFEGLCCVNYKLRRGEPVVFEINPRLGRSATAYFFAFLRHLAPGRT